MFSVKNDYSRESFIIHNAVQVHLSIAIQKAIAIMLLFVDRFHINVSLKNFHLITIGAYFCESLVRDDKQYYHSRRSFCNFIVVDYVVTMEYANEKGWVINKNIETNPIVRIDPDEKSANAFSNRLTIVTKRISDNNGTTNPIIKEKIDPDDEDAKNFTNRLTIVTRRISDTNTIEMKNSPR